MPKEKEFCAGIVPFFEEAGIISVLLIQHIQGHWGFPKGHIEEGETPFQAAERELLEETNLKIQTKISEASIEEFYQLSRNGKQVDKWVKYFVCFVQDQNITLCKTETKNFQWVVPKEAPTLITFDESKRVFRQATELLN